MILYVIIAALLIGFLHLFHWEKVLNRELTAPLTYIVGVAVLGGTFTAWVLLEQVANPTQIIVGWWAMVGASGLMDVALYGLEWITGLARAFQVTNHEQDH